jgi:hypothetical protein
VHPAKEESMRANRYLNVVLTVIAIELGWIGLAHLGTPVSAQQTPTQVVITGVQMPQTDTVPITVRGIDLRNTSELLPVGLSNQPIKVEIDRPLRIVEPVTVRIPVTSSLEFAK